MNYSQSVKYKITAINYKQFIAIYYMFYYILPRNFQVYCGIFACYSEFAVYHAFTIFPLLHMLFFTMANHI